MRRSTIIVPPAIHGCVLPSSQTARVNSGVPGTGLTVPST